VIRVSGSEVYVRIEDDAPVTRVRYAWGDSPIVNLNDGSGLPAGPIELAVNRD
jgi:sialate O-acetylesterase